VRIPVLQPELIPLRQPGGAFLMKQSLLLQRLEGCVPIL
jgi:hypothetical protein